MPLNRNQPPIGAVTFDLWDTVFLDDSDEPKRRQMGLPTKKVERRDIVSRFLAESGQPVLREALDRAYDETDEAFRKSWHDEYATWTVAARLRKVLAKLERELPPERFSEMVLLHEEMELRIRPDLITGASEALESLHSRYKLIVISDAIFTPGRGLRELLSGYGLLDMFSGFIFSDEFGRSKPAPEVFHRAAELAKCPVGGLLHVGDREHNDIAGPQGVGARAVLLTAGIDRGSAATKADRICTDYRELSGIIESMDGSRK
jgi:putative hydrolase of the HAD superfamily